MSPIKIWGCSMCSFKRRVLQMWLYHFWADRQKPLPALGWVASWGTARWWFISASHSQHIAGRLWQALGRHVQPELCAGSVCEAQSNQSSVSVLPLRLYPDHAIFFMVKLVTHFPLQLCPKRGREGSNTFFIVLALQQLKEYYFFLIVKNKV